MTDTYLNVPALRTDEFVINMRFETSLSVCMMILLTALMIFHYGEFQVVHCHKRRNDETNASNSSMCCHANDEDGSTMMARYCTKP